MGELAGRRAGAPAWKAAARKAATKAAASSSPTTARASSRSTTVPALPAPPTDPLVILGLTGKHTRTQLRRAWQTYATTHHPDQGGDVATFTRGLLAYETLLARLD